ncbi:SGNH hydrolase-type esterase domain-containing protein [Lasiosphaeria hispida]|uniref:SGNH hydrolase-type esterase domain-containing protein n=1 Tax=Lasiosphaeria hispida TaxID=260671 RepID=A0AAJ0HII1_9PEZI|nr:SGNH hydrolase-type esterase domain-containing protein [Lasiosphaeria hispida]
MAALFVGLSAPLAHGGVAVNHFNLAARAIAPFPNPVPLRIMPLGASITWGQASSEGNGYRAELRYQLTSAGNVVNMVGSRQHGNMADSDVEGWPGFRIDQVHQKAREVVPQWKPNVFLINVGTNDAVQSRNISTAGERMEQMINDLYSMSPRATVLLSTLLLNRNPATERNVQSINQQFTSLIPKLRMAGRRIILVDMRSDQGPVDGDLFDETHPNDSGYRKMANIWYTGLFQASDLGFLQGAEAVPGVPDNGA